MPDGSNRPRRPHSLSGRRAARATSTSGSGPHLLRALSVQTVLDAIIAHGPISRADIARRTGLSKPTVSSVVAGLLQGGLVTEGGRRTGHTGRAAVLYGVDASVGCVIGVDVGGTSLRAAVSDLHGRILSESREPTDRHGGRRVLTQIATCARRVAGDAGVDWGRVLAVGLATPGIQNPETGQIRLAPNVPGLQRVNLQRGLAAELETPVLIQNDVNAAALGEQWHGLGQGVSTFAFIAVGTGVGMGLIVNDELFVGAHGSAGEIGYLPLAADPFDARHRLRGPFEDEASGPALVRRAASRFDADPPRTAREIFALAEAGNPVAAEIVTEEARLLATAVASVCAVLDPELVVLGGGIGSNRLILPAVREAVRRLVPAPPRIERSRLGDRAAVHGAVSIALSAARDRLLGGHERVAGAGRAGT